MSRETYVTLTCAGKRMARLDVSRAGYLAIYWSSGFYYLKKVS